MSGSKIASAALSSSRGFPRARRPVSASRSLWRHRFSGSNISSPLRTRSLSRGAASCRSPSRTPTVPTRIQSRQRARRCVSHHLVASQCLELTALLKSGIAGTGIFLGLVQAIIFIAILSYRKRGDRTLVMILLTWPFLTARGIYGILSVVRPGWSCELKLLPFRVYAVLMSGRASQTLTPPRMVRTGSRRISLPPNMPWASPQNGSPASSCSEPTSQP